MSATNGNGTHTNGRGTLNLADARRLTPPVERLGERAQAARAAIAEAVSNDDIAEIMRKQVEKAKAGDVGSAKFVLDQVAGKMPSMQVSVGVRGRPPAKDEYEEQHSPRLVLASPSNDLSKDKTVGESRRTIARYLAKNGPTPWQDLAELFLIEKDCEEPVMEGCGWFERCKDGWHLTTTGRKESGA